MRPFFAVEAQIIADTPPCFFRRRIVINIHVLVFDRAPQPFGENVINGSTAAVHAYLRALKSDPSPQQRARITLSVGEKLIALDRGQEAYEAYQQLLKAFPDYADKLGLCKKLLPLAQKLNKKSDAEEYEAEIKSLSVANN